MKKEPKNLRCAAYTRKSTEEGLYQDFNSLDAQRESAEAYVKAQQHEGWQCLATKYDDGGYTGANTDRPALKRLMADIEAGKIDCVVVYKVDRLSRSLLDFARLLEVFDRHGVTFVSVTQSFNTADSAGRLMLHILLSFAQYEREMISERTRDKMSAARKKGKYIGGTPVLGYDVDRATKKLIVNKDEAALVVAIFELYAEYRALLPVVQELERRRSVNKRWRTQKGIVRGGKPFTKTSLHRLLTNVTFLGKLRYRDEVYAGEHQAIVPLALWQKVQASLERNSRTGGAPVRNKYSALLKGLLRCSACGCAMTPTYTAKGPQRYHYYVCSSAQKRGWNTCPSKSVPAAEIERVVVEQISGIGGDPKLARATFAEASRQTETRTTELAAERRRLDRERASLAKELARGGSDVAERLVANERRTAEVAAELAALGQAAITADEVTTALGSFSILWESLAPREQVRVIELLVESVEYHGGTGNVAITFRPTGIRALAEKYATEDAA
jgi:site-specific DNA recombinase